MPIRPAFIFRICSTYRAIKEGEEEEEPPGVACGSDCTYNRKCCFYCYGTSKHPCGKRGRFRKSPPSRRSFCSSSALNPAVSPLSPPSLPASKPLRLKKENSYLLVYWGCVLTIYHVCIYSWVRIVSLVLFEAGGECLKKKKWFGKYAFFFFLVLKLKKKNNRQKATTKNPTKTHLSLP